TGPVSRACSSQRFLRQPTHHDGIRLLAVNEPHQPPIDSSAAPLPTMAAVAPTPDNLDPPPSTPPNTATPPQATATSTPPNPATPNPPASNP
uniref:Uncharacterized protein n=1 Tax=Aegilops tauschii subsp. strangulata TaxID=200361 RepID=A0A453RTP7_AEGTS